MAGEERSKRKPMTKESLEAKREALNKSRGEYGVMKQQFENFRDSRQEEFEKNIRNIIPEDDLEKIELESDPLAVYRTLKKYEQEYIDDQVEEKRDELEAFEDELHKEEQMLGAYEIEAQFGEDNPDLDFEGMLAHLERNMSPARKEELLEKAQGDNLVFLNLVRDDFVGGSSPEIGNNENGEEDPDLPTDLSKVAGESGDLENEGEEGEEEDYLASIGLG